MQLYYNKHVKYILLNVQLNLSALYIWNCLSEHTTNVDSVISYKIKPIWNADKIIMIILLLQFMN